jgi:hypothetical protein
MECLSVEGTSQWDWAQTAALIVPLITLFGAIITVAITYGLNQRATRRERQAKAFAEALAAIEDYAQMPYRIRRRPDTVEARHEISMELNQIQSRIAFQHAWIQIEAAEVGPAYDLLIHAVRDEAGLQMKAAWNRRASTSDKEMTLEGAYPRDQIDAARSQCIIAMRAALGRGKVQGSTLLRLPR